MSDTKLQEQVNEIKNRILRTESADWRNFAFTINQNLKDWQSSTAKEQLKASIKRGFLNTFNVWEDPETGNLECLDGKHRVDVLLELQNEGMSIPELLPTNFIECKDRKEAAKNVLIYSSFYAQITPIGIQEYSRINEIQIEKMPEINLPPMPIIEELEAIPIQHEAVEDDFDTTPPAVAKTVLGDLYEIGLHRVLCGDSTDVTAVAKLMQGELADMVMTDPPYNVAIQGGNHGDPSRTNGKRIINDSMEDHEFYAFLLLFYTAFADVTKAGGSWYVWYASRETINFHKAMIDAGITPKQNIIWVKSSIVMGRQDYQWKHEPCIYGWKEGAAHYFTDDRTKTTVLHHDKPTRNDLHPTMKPILLLAPLIENSSKQGWLVADPFLGSGSTMVAAHQLKRKCYGMEISPQYTDVTIKRMLSLDSTLRVKRNGVDVTEEWRD